MSSTSGKILLVSATKEEMLEDEFDNTEKLITGVGMVATATALTRKLTNANYGLVINMGIAGSFKPELSIGAVVQVVSERLVELGVEDHDLFISADEMGLCKQEDVQFSTTQITELFATVSGITVNKVHGSAASIEKVSAQFNPDVETMEGAAVAYVCRQFNIPWVELRAISNIVEPRNRDAWDIPKAIKQLKAAVLMYINSISDHD